MPELPEVVSLAHFLEEVAGTKVVQRAQLASFAALKTFDPPLEAIVGRTLAETGRRGKWLVLGFDPPPTRPEGRIFLVVHLARGGWVQWKDPLPTVRPKPSPKSPLALRLGFEDGTGFDITEAGTEKRLALYVVRDPADVEGVARLGPDVMDPAFDAAALGERLREAGGAQLKGVIADQAVIAGVGNAYSDEALNVARMSPFKKASSLTPDDVEVLWLAIRGVLTDAIDRSMGLPAKGLKSEKKSGLRVHGRTGQPCPACGDTVREVSFATKSFQYCPTCQTGGKPLADRRLSRLLK